MKHHLVLLVLLFPSQIARGQGESLTYWKDIRPIFRKYCTVCHSAKNIKEADVSGGLALDSYEAVRKGTTKPIFLPGKSKDSTIIHLLESTDVKKRMPLDAKALAADKIALIRRWIDSGAKEGTKPDDATVTLIPKKPGKRRRLDVTLPTNAIAPAGTLAKIGGKLDLAMKVGPLAPVTAVTFSPDNKLLASGCYGLVTIWDLTSAQPVKMLTNVLGAVNDLRFSPDGKILAVAGGQPSAKGDLRLFQVEDWKLLAALRGHDDVVFAVDFSRDGKRLASASFDKTVRIWNLEQRAAGLIPAERVLTGHSDFVYAVAFSPDGKHLATASKDRTVKLVETETGKGVFTFGGMNEDILAVAFSPDGKQVVSSGFETALYWWNPKTGERLRLQGGHGIAVHELAFSKDGSRLLSASADRTIRLWNGSTGAPMKSIGVGSIVYAAAISPNNKLLASGSFDGLVKVWDEASGRLLATLISLPLENEQHDWLALTPEGYAAGSAGMSTLVRWRLAGQETPGERVWQSVRQPEMIARSLRGEKLAAPKFETTKSTKDTKKKAKR
jgi:WD40 repeat protein